MSQNVGTEAESKATATSTSTLYTSLDATFKCVTGRNNLILRSKLTYFFDRFNKNS